MKYLHVSAPIGHVIDPKTGLPIFFVVRPGVTYRRKKSREERYFDSLPGRQRRRLRKLIRRERKEHS